MKLLKKHCCLLGIYLFLLFATSRSYAGEGVLHEIIDAQYIQWYLLLPVKKSCDPLYLQHLQQLCNDTPLCTLDVSMDLCTGNLKRNRGRIQITYLCKYVKNRQVVSERYKKIATHGQNLIFDNCTVSVARHSQE
jgi:O-glycosyl hydrolase